MSTDLPDVDCGTREFADRFAAWTSHHEDELRPLMSHHVDFDLSVEQSRRLRAILWDAGWGRFGWPTSVGGLGGTITHRALISEQLFNLGWDGPTIFEHAEIIAPTLVRFASPELAARVVPAFVRGDEAWSQGFSEPEAGSDLAALRTRARIDGDRLVVNGSKIWTSWAKWARWCLALVRTGTTEERHRGLTMVAIDLESPGVRVAPIRQANGTDELAEAFFDDVQVPIGNVVGEIGRGWDVAMWLLARERGTLSWLKQGEFRNRVVAESKTFSPGQDAALGDFIVRWAGVRAAAIELLHRDSNAARLGPEAAYNKLLMTRAEQDLYNLVHDSTGTRVALPLDEDDEQLERAFHFSRIVTVYGGSQQMQLITIAKHVLGVGRA